MERKLFYLNRVGYSFFTGMAVVTDCINVINTPSAGPGHPIPLGFLTNHIGTFPEAVAAFVGYGSAEYASIGLTPKEARLRKLLIPAIFWFAVVAAELTGFHNTPDLRDIPAEAVGFLGTACFLELVIPKARHYLSENFF